MKETQRMPEFLLSQGVAGVFFLGVVLNIPEIPYLSDSSAIFS